MNGVNNLHIYNRVEITGGVQVGGVMNPIGKDGANSVVVKKYLTSAFIDRRNIKVAISPVSISEVKAAANNQNVTRSMDVIKRTT